MLRGEIRVVDFDPAEAGEANKRRPAVIVSNDGANAAAARFGRGVITVVPLTSNIHRVYPFQVLLPADAVGLSRDSKVQTEQVRAVSFERLGARIGAVPALHMLEVDAALRVHLAL